MTNTIQKTPLIKVQYQYKGRISCFYTKLEFYQMTGSIKDRVAWYILQKAKEKGILQKGMPIIEATSGNTGIALAALGAREGHPVTIFMPNWASKERIELMKSYGAKVCLISAEEGGFLACVEQAKALAKEFNGFLANQFSNPDNILAHYETTGKEIVEQVPESIGALVSGVGTGGTLIGTRRRIKKAYPNAKIIALEPDSMPLLSGGKVTGAHKIEGIGDEFVPELVKKEEIDAILLINDEESIQIAQKIATELGIGVGISSGANALACILAKETVAKEDAIVTVFADDNKKYLSTDLGKTTSKTKSNIANQIKFIKYDMIKE